MFDVSLFENYIVFNEELEKWEIKSDAPAKAKEAFEAYSSQEDKLITRN